jgi:hypothetical protein
MVTTKRRGKAYSSRGVSVCSEHSLGVNNAPFECSLVTQKVYFNTQALIWRLLNTMLVCSEGMGPRFVVNTHLVLNELVAFIQGVY